MPQPSEAKDLIFIRSKELLFELCGISSASGELDGLRRVAARLGEELRVRGLAVEIVEEVGSEGQPQPSLVARGPLAGERYLLLVGHMDTVLPAIPPRIEGDRLIATGGLDMKAGLVMLVGALDMLAARGQQPPQDLLLVAVPDEEVGGQISESVVRRWGAGARAMLVLEPGERACDAETLVAGRRGMAEWRLDVVGKAAHSGLAYWEGRSAAAAAADWAAQAQALSERGPGVTVNVARMIGGDADFVGNLAAHHELLGSPRRRNVVSERAVAEGEVRFLSIEDRERVLGALAALAERVAAAHGVATRFERGFTVPPVDPKGPGAALVEKAVALARARGWSLVVEEDRGGISFPNYLEDPGKVPLVDGLGPVGEGMHTRDEYMSLDSFARRIELLADLLAEA